MQSYVDAYDWVRVPSVYGALARLSFHKKHTSVEAGICALRVIILQAHG